MCEQDSPAQGKEKHLAHEVPKQPWDKVGVNLWRCKGKDYLVVVDYLTDFFEVGELPSTLSVVVIQALKQLFARHGVPLIVHSDGGPQFTSALQKGMSLVEKRKKLIKLADRSEAGWAVVDEYVDDDLADNSDDEKKKTKRRCGAESQTANQATKKK